MDSKKPILPVRSSSFKRDANNLFSLSTDQLSNLVEAYISVRKKRALFSIAHVNNIVKLDPDRAKSTRSTFIYLVDIMKECADPSKAVEELVLVGCDKQKVEFFAKRIKS